jgi:hypothetical protein
MLGNGQPATSPHQQTVPIASVAKVMTALLTLTHYPLSATQSGFTVTVTTAEAQAEAKDAAEGQFVVAVEDGEQLTERQLLEGLLIPSGNNIAQVFAGSVAGSDARFVTEMNAEAKALGLIPGLPSSGIGVRSLRRPSPHVNVPPAPVGWPGAQLRTDETHDVVHMNPEAGQRTVVLGVAEGKDPAVRSCDPVAPGIGCGQADDVIRRHAEAR